MSVGAYAGPPAGMGGERRPRRPFGTSTAGLERGCQDTDVRVGMRVVRVGRKRDALHPRVDRQAEDRDGHDVPPRPVRRLLRLRWHADATPHAAIVATVTRLSG